MYNLFPSYARVVKNNQKAVKYRLFRKKNDCMPSILRKDNNFGHEDEIEVKNTVSFSLSTEELQIEQSNKITWIEEISNIVDKGINNYSIVYDKKMLESQIKCFSNSSKFLISVMLVCDKFPGLCTKAQCF